MRIGVLNNLRAGRNRAGVSRLLRVLDDHPHVAHVETAGPEQLPDALGELARKDVELLVVNGGDGTVQHVLTEILGRGAFGGRVPLVAPLRGGRTNMTALDLGARRNPVRGLRGLLRAAAADDLAARAEPRQVLRVEIDGGADVRYGVFFGVGVIHRGIEIVHRMFPQGRSQGVFGATVVTAALLARAAFLGDHKGLLAPDDVRMLLDGFPADRGLSRVVMATTLNRLFAGMRPFWGEGPGEVRLTAITAGARAFHRVLPRLLVGRPGPGVGERDGYTSRNVKRADLRLHCGFTVDGELVAPSPGRIVTVTAEDPIDFVRA